jgi:S1-C subfamily serine protease
MAEVEARSGRVAPRCEQCGQPLVLGECGMCKKPKAVAAAAAVQLPAEAPVEAAATTAAAPLATPATSSVVTGTTTSPASPPLVGTAGPAVTTPPAAPAAKPRVQATAPAIQPLLTNVLLGIVTLLVLASGYLFLTVSDLKSKLNDVEAQAQANNGQFTQLGGQIKVIDSAEKDIAAKLDATAAADPTAIATKVQPSVWTIATGEVLGSGWVVQSDATSSTFITNFHVIATAVADGSNAVKVFQDKGAQLDGTIGQYDTNADLALVTVQGQLPALALSNETPLPGAPVLVVGSPLGLGGSVTTGSISALRDIDGINYIQFSAPISPGNSGGPLVNAAGKVIGVTVAKVIGGGAEGIGLAIPVSQVCDRLKFCP